MFGIYADIPRNDEHLLGRGPAMTVLFRCCCALVGAAIVVWLLSGGIMIHDAREYRGAHSNIRPGDGQDEPHVHVAISGQYVHREVPWAISRIGEVPPYELTLEANFPAESPARTVVVGRIHATVTGVDGRTSELDISPAVLRIELREFSYGNQESTGYVKHTVWNARQRIAPLSGLDFARHERCRIYLDGSIESESQDGPHARPFRCDVEFIRIHQRSIRAYFAYLLTAE